MTNTSKETDYRMPDDQLIIKGRVSMARMANGLQKQDVAKMLSDNDYPISSSNYGQKETSTNGYYIKKDMLIVLADIYDLPINTFLYGQLTKPKNAPKLEDLSNSLNDVVLMPKAVPYELIQEPAEVSEHRKEVKSQLDNDMQTVVNVKNYFETVVERMQNNLNQLKGDD